MFSKNPKRVAESQLNKAELDLLEVYGHLESYESNKQTLLARIARLRAYLAEDEGVAVTAQEGRVPGVLKVGRGLTAAAG